MLWFMGLERNTDIQTHSTNFITPTTDTGGNFSMISLLTCLQAEQIPVRLIRVYDLIRKIFSDIVF